LIIATLGLNSAFVTIHVGAEHSGGAHLFNAVGIQHEACHSLKSPSHLDSMNQSRQKCNEFAGCAACIANALRKSEQFVSGKTFTISWQVLGKQHSVENICCVSSSSRVNPHGGMRRPALKKIFSVPCVLSNINCLSGVGFEPSCGWHDSCLCNRDAVSWPISK
jgi:hypothetical protein